MDQEPQWVADIAGVLLAVPAITLIVSLAYLAAWYWGL